MGDRAPAAPLSTGIVALLALAVFINYFDRGTLSTAAPLVQRELGLSNTEMGVLFSAFFWSYAPVQPLAGWLAQRFEVRWVLGIGLAVWGLATALTGLAHGFWALLLMRVALGLGESVAYPCNAHYLGLRAAAHQRGRANGSIAVGQSLGPACGTLLGGMLVAAFGWRVAFVAFGLASLLWLIPWFRVTRNGATAGNAADIRPLPYGVLLRERALWGTGLGHFCGNYAFYLLLTWLPLLLVQHHGFTMPQMATIGAGVYTIQAVVAPLTGWWCDRRIARGGSTDRVLKTTISLGLAGVAATMCACAFAGAPLTVALMLLSGVFFGMQSAPLGAITQTLGGARAAGQWMGIQNLCANFAGVLAPALTGYVVDRTGAFEWAFLIAAAVSLLGTLAYGVVIRRVAPVAWPAPAAG